MNEKENNPEKKKKSHLLAISLVLGMALFNVATEQVIELKLENPLFWTSNISKLQTTKFRNL